MPGSLPNPEDDATKDMTSGASSIISFIVRIWREEPTSQKSQAIWRGHITPVHEGERQYFTDIKEIPAFIAEYLKAQR